jgi:gamma-glutamyltranspeptidase/glutathione hydrolase/leukotriene-C4 hydrolase
MDDFSVPDRDNIYDLPPSPSNMIEPGKRPLSSMVPSIVLDKEGNVRLIIGGAGGTIITTSVAFALLEHIFKGKSLEEAINMSRMHHQLLPMEVKCEEGFDPKILKDLKVKFNHALNMVEKSDGFSALTAISNISHIITAIYDRRRGGGSLVF